MIYKLYKTLIIFMISFAGCSKEVPEIKTPPENLKNEITFRTFRKDFPGKGVIKARYDQGHYFVLLEKLSGFKQRVPGERFIEILNTEGETTGSVNNRSSVLIDACFFNEYIYMASIIPENNDESVVIEKYNATGQILKRSVLFKETNSKVVIDDRLRIVANATNIYIAAFRNNETIILYALDKNTLTEKWSLLVEPELHRMPWGMTGGSFDAFGQQALQYSVFLDCDENGNAYVAVPVMGGNLITTLYYHNKYFGESHSNISEHSGDLITPVDALITKVSQDGQRVYSRVIGTGNADEIHGIRVFNNFLVTYGRTAITNFNDWNPYLTINELENGDAHLAINYNLGGNEIFLSAGYNSITGHIFLGGIGDWSQNPNGVSISEYGNKILLSVNDQNGAIDTMHTLKNGLRQNQIRSIQVLNDSLLMIAGWENGPGTHSGDSNNDLIYADGFMIIQ